MTSEELIEKSSYRICNVNEPVIHKNIALKCVHMAYNEGKHKAVESLKHAICNCNGDLTKIVNLFTKELNT